MAIRGAVQDGFESVRKAFADGQANDGGGAQLCVYRHGKKVVDLATGRDVKRDRPYTTETLSVMMSATKGVVATAALILVERGLLDPDTPVSGYWPEFAQNGKAEILVSQVLAHSAGLAAYPAEVRIGVKELLAWNKPVTALAEMEPLWPPGTATAYHALTYGYLAGEIIRRISGRSVGTFVADEIAGPLKLDLWIGLPADQEERVAPQYSTGNEILAEQAEALLKAFGIDPNARVVRALMATAGTAEDTNRFMNSREAHAAEIPAGNGITNARALAKMYAATISEVDGVRLLKRDTVDRARRPMNAGLKLPEPLSRLPAHDTHLFGLGYELSRHATPMLGEGSFGHTGAGGRLGFAHPESGIAVGYICNNMSWDPMRGPDPRWVPWLSALKDVAQHG
jgi:CubicO group peptidase (beta-lactamase class C family)